MWTNLRIWWRRKITYRLTWLTLCILTIYACLWLFQGLQERITILLPRLIDSGRQTVWLSLDGVDSTLNKDFHLEDWATQQMKARYGIPVMLIRPKLKLIGTVEDIQTTHGALKARLGIYQPDMNRLTENTKLRFQSEPPSLSLLIEEVSQSPRGQIALKRLDLALKMLKQEAGTIFSLLWQDLKEAIPQDILERLANDPKILERVELHFQNQFIDQLPWEQLLSSTLDSKEFEAIQSKALQGIEIQPMISEFSKTAFSNYFKSKSIWRGVKDRNPIKIFGRVKDNFTQKTNKSIDEGVKKVSEQVKEVIKQNLAREQNLIKKEGGKLLARQAKEAQINQYVVKWAEALTHDQVLLKYFQEQYQPELIDKAKEGLVHFKDRAEVHALVTKSWTMLLDAGIALVQAMIFDHRLENPGPNPLLIAVIEELIRGEQNVFVHVIPQAGQTIKSGHLYHSSVTPPSSDWLSRLINRIDVLDKIENISLPNQTQQEDLP